MKSVIQKHKNDTHYQFVISIHAHIMDFKTSNISHKYQVSLITRAVWSCELHKPFRTKILWETESSCIGEKVVRKPQDLKFQNYIYQVWTNACVLNTFWNEIFLWFTPTEAVKFQYFFTQTNVWDLSNNYWFLF